MLWHELGSLGPIWICPLLVALLWLFFKSLKYIIVFVEYFTGFKIVMFSSLFWVAIMLGGGMAWFVIPSALIYNYNRIRQLKRLREG